MKSIKRTNLVLELLLVIVGITITFSLDNWRESKKSVRTEQEYLLSFKYDLQKDNSSTADVS